MRKVTNSYKNYSQDNLLWSNLFLKYQIIFLKLFSTITISLYLDLL